MRSTEFWPYKIAKELVKKFPDVEKQVISSGTSMSGEPHIGNANDVIRADAIFQACKKLGIEAELNWVSDDMDPLRSVPAGMPKEMHDYLGMPVSSVPDFWQCHENFARHFEEIFLEQLKDVLVEPVAYFGYDMYRKGMYNETIKIAMEKRKEIMEILNKFRTKPLQEDWYPISVICQNCGKIATTKIISYDAEKNEVSYVCSEQEVLLHKKYFVKGCGYEGKVSIFNGTCKLVWRVEWPARWSFLKVTCEGMGKEHYIAGGSYDTGKEIVKLFGWKAPYPFFYEHFLVNGQKMSKSKGNVVTLPDMLRYMTAEQIRYWMFQGSLTTAKDIRLKEMTPHVMDEFDRAERVYFGIEQAKSEKEKNNLIKAYEIAVVNVPKEIRYQVPFNIAKQIVSFIDPASNFELAKELIEKVLRKKIDKHEDYVKERLQKVRNWVEDFGEVIKLAKLDEVKQLLSQKEKEILSNLAERIASVQELNEEKLFEEIKALAKEFNISHKEIFKTCYKVLIGKEEGPRLYYLIKALGLEISLKRFKLEV